MVDMNAIIQRLVDTYAAAPDYPHTFIVPDNMVEAFKENYPGVRIIPISETYLLKESASKSGSS